MLAERLQADELMDDPDLPENEYHAVLADLAKVNSITLAYRPTLDFLARALRGRRQFTLLDVGFGDGDMLRAVSRWAQKRGLAARMTGIDLNPRSRAAALRTPSRGAEIEFLTGDYESLAGRGFDFVISSLVAHHMTCEQLIAFLRFMDEQATLGWFINDLHRHGFAYAGFPILAQVMRWHQIVRHDGRMSIARSYRPAEWMPLLAEAGVEDASVTRRFPFRLCVEKIR